MKDSPKIEFISMIKGLTSISECLPKPASSFIPKWWKNTPPESNGVSTIKMCPAYPDYFSEGFILPMWTDVKLKFNKETGDWNWETRSQENPFLFDVHYNSQLIDHKVPTYQGEDGKFVFKFISPWKIITPPGYSVLQLPPFYHFNKDFSVAPGILHTDIYHSTNQQIFYHSSEKEIVIERGAPLVHYIPYKRKEYSLEVREYTAEDEQKIRSEDLSIVTKLNGSGWFKKFKKTHPYHQK